MKCEISLWKCKFKLILRIADCWERFICVPDTHTHTRTVNHQIGWGRLDSCFFSTVCPGFSLMAAILQKKTKKQQLFPPPIVLQPGVSSTQHFQSSSSPTVSVWRRKHNSAMQTRANQVWWSPHSPSSPHPACFVSRWSFFVSSCSAVQMGFFYF